MAELTEVYGAEAPIQRPSPTVLLTLAGGARRSYLIWIALRELNQSYQGYQDSIFVRLGFVNLGPTTRDPP
jgi:hypothetical protein